MTRDTLQFLLILHVLAGGLGVDAQCSSPLGMEDSSIPDDKIQSWSPIQGRLLVARARLNDQFAWCSAEGVGSKDAAFLQITLDKPRQISGIATKGFADFWITEYVVEYKVGNSFQRYKEPNSDTEIIKGNSNGEDVLKKTFAMPFVTQVVRMIPIAQHGLSCLRLELYGCDAPSPAYKTCKELQDTDPQNAKSNKAYELQVDSNKIQVFCHMTTINECGAGAWTLAMKIDGSKNTFNYNSNYWKDKNAYNENGGLTGFDNQETKLPTYSNTPFTRICLGMKVGSEMKFIPIAQQAASLHSLIADGQYRSTSLGRDGWKSLVSGGTVSLQSRCNREGFNAASDGDRWSKVRIGIISNNENDCYSTDSRVGFGSGGYPDDSNSCGFIARHGGDNGDKDAKAMGYIFIGSPPPLNVYKTCKELRNAEPLMANSNRAYQLATASGNVPVYCHMTDLSGCGSGGWTLVMKIDGSKNTFNYDSAFWSNKNSFNVNGGLSGLDDQETKLPTYWSTSFSRICLGMKVGGQTRFILLKQGASSLFSLIADGKHRPTSLPRNTWKSLVPGSSLQQRCGRQGFNSGADRNGWSKARIGIIYNNENDCSTPDSRVGFGTGGYPDTDNMSCGNVAKHGGDNGDKSITATGYIFVM